MTVIYYQIHFDQVYFDQVHFDASGKGPFSS